MRVKNLVSWSGPDWQSDPGDEIDLPDDIALARVAAGLCATLPITKVSTKLTQPTKLASLS